MGHPTSFRTLRLAAIGLILAALLAAFWFWGVRREPSPPVRVAAVAARPVATSSAPDGVTSVRLPSACPVIFSPTPPTAEQRSAAGALVAAANRAALLGDLRAATLLYLQSAELDPTSSTVAYRLGRAYEDLGESDNATREYCRYLALVSTASDTTEVRARIADLARLESSRPESAAENLPAPRATANARESGSSPGANRTSSRRSAETAARPGASPTTPPPVNRTTLLGAEATPPAALREPEPTPIPAAEAAEREGIAAVIASYARAIESRSVAALRQTYPELSAREQRAWEQFFAKARELRADLTVEEIEVAGPVAEVRVRGTYIYENTSLGRAERAPVAFRATLSRSAAGWQLNAIR